MVVGCVVDAEVVAGFAPAPKRPVEEAEFNCVPNRPDPAGLLSEGGAPAGVVDGRKDIGFAGVAVAAGGADEVGVLPPLLANSEFPVLANKPDAGAADDARVDP